MILFLKPGKICCCLLLAMILTKQSTAQLGIIMAKDINPGAADSDPNLLTNVKGTLFFLANDGVNGSELWKYDGTTSTTTLVKDINNVKGYGSDISEMVNVGGTLFFNANDGTNGKELWKSDGTNAGTVMVKNIFPNSPGSRPSHLVNLNGTLIFWADDGAHDNGAYGKQLWKSDGTSTGTVLLSDLKEDWDLIRFAKINNEVFFTATPKTGGVRTVYRTNGITTRVAVNTADVYCSTLTAVNSTLFITSYKNVSQLWKIGPNSNEIVLVKDIIGSIVTIRPTELANMNGTLFFGTNGGRGLWKSDGTEAGTVVVKMVPGVSFGNFTVVNNTLFLTSNTALYGYQLWKSDGTTGGTVLVPNSVRFTRLHNLININGKLFFVAEDSINGGAIWNSGGTSVGTKPAYDIEKVNRVGGSYLSDLTTMDGMLCIVGNDGIHGRELWIQVNCTTLPITSTNYSVTQNVSNNYFFDNTSCSKLIMKIDPHLAWKVIGNTTATIWKETIQQVNFVKRHYEIIPAPGLPKCKVTLYFTQQEFNDFNAVNSVKLPGNANDIANIANLYIVQYTGKSKPGTGLPESYPGSGNMINPDDKDIIWNADNNRWEVSFNTTTFGGFFVQTKIAPIR